MTSLSRLSSDYAGVGFSSLQLLNSLLRRLTKNIGSKAVNESVNWCPGKIQRSKEPVGMSGLFQTLLGQAAELLDPQLQQRPETLRLVGVNAFF